MMIRHQVQVEDARNAVNKVKGEIGDSSQALERVIYTKYSCITSTNTDKHAHAQTRLRTNHTNNKAIRDAVEPGMAQVSYSHTARHDTHTNGVSIVEMVQFSHALILYS